MIYEKEKRYIIPFADVPAERAEMPEISVDERRENFTEVETGFPEEMAIKEAKRCLGCALCWAECEPEAIDFDIPDEELELEFDDVVITRGQDNAFHPFDSQLGYGSFADVISDLQFERSSPQTDPPAAWCFLLETVKFPNALLLYKDTRRTKNPIFFPA